MTRDELIFRTGLTRIVLGLVAVTAFPAVYPRMGTFYWVYLLYILFALVEQLIIKRGIGGAVRSIVAGLFDLGIIAFTVHRLGSVATPAACLCILAGVLNALVITPRVGMWLAMMNTAGYAAVVWSEHLGLLPFAPDVPALQAMGRPTFAQAMAATLLISVVLLGSTAVVSLLVKTIQSREAALVEANHRLEELSQRDPLTGLFNRRHLFERIEHELERVRRGHSLAVLMIDLDGFKRINDHDGHLRGDALLKEVAGALGTTVRVTDLVGRYGGDEFVVVLPDTDEEKARTVADRVAAAVREVGLRFDADRPITASVGLAVAGGSDAVAPLLRVADERAYRAKRDGGDRVAVSL
jgi:diguanylate cyclase (GGDEF)-like protein